MVELEKRTRAIENAETPRSPEWLQNLTDQQQKTASPVVPFFPLSLSSSSDSNFESSSGSSDSESSESAVKRTIPLKEAHIEI